MLRVASRSTKASASQFVSRVPRRFAHGASYGPEEPLGYYLKWVGVVSLFTGALVYDRFYSDGAISKVFTPETDSEAIEAQRKQWADRLAKEQERNIELLYPRERATHLTTFSAHPVPAGSFRASYTSDVVDLESISERRPRAVR